MKGVISNAFIEDIPVVLESLLNTLADLVAAAKFRPEFAILVLPFGTKTRIKKIAEFFEKQLPGRFAVSDGTQYSIE